MSEFRDTLQHHLSQTRAGLYGQFEHSFNFEQGFDQDPKFKLGAGESITFTGALLSGGPLTLVATNNLTGPAGSGFIAQTSDPNSATVLVGAVQDRGQVELAFSAPSGGGVGSTTSVTNFPEFRTGPQRYEGYDQDDVRIFTKSVTGDQIIADVVRAASGVYYTLSRSASQGVTTGECSSAGLFNWSIAWPEVGVGGFLPHIAFCEPPTSMVITAVNLRNGDKVRGYDTTVVGGPLAHTWETTLPTSSSTAFIEDMKVGRGPGAAYVYIAINASGAVDNIYQLDAATGTILNSFSFTPDRQNRPRLAVQSTGHVIVMQTYPSEQDGGGVRKNAMRLDHDLNLLKIENIDWSPANLIFQKPFPEAYVTVANPAVDGADNIYIVERSGYAYKYDPTLTTVEAGWPKRLVGDSVPRRPRDTSVGN